MKDNQLSLRLNKAIFTVKVKCCNAHHRIALTDSGRLRLLDHRDDMEAMEGMRLLNPGFRCRCLEVKEWWRVYLRGERVEADHEGMGHFPYPLPVWMAEALTYTDDYGDEKKREHTHKFAFYQLPKPLRPYAEAALDTHMIRREHRWSDPTGKLVEMQERGRTEAQQRVYAIKTRVPLANKARMPIGFSAKEEVKAEFLRRMLDKYHTPELSVAYQGVNGSGAREFLSYGMKLPFWREALAEGLVITSGPPAYWMLANSRSDTVFFVEAREIASTYHLDYACRWYSVHHTEGEWEFRKLLNPPRLHNLSFPQQ